MKFNLLFDVLVGQIRIKLLNVSRLDQWLFYDYSVSLIGRSTVQCWRFRAVIWLHQPTFGLVPESNLHCRVAESTLHSLVPESTIHCLVPESLSLVNPPLCVSQPTLHYWVAESTLHCWVAGSTLHCLVPESTLYCLHSSSSAHDSFPLSSSSSVSVSP